MSKIIFVHLFNDRSGSPKVLSQVVMAMHERGAEVEVLTSDHIDGFLDSLPGRRRQIFYRRSENKLLTLLLYLVSQALLFMYCLRYWRQDTVFYVNTMMPFGAALAAKFMGKPVIYHVHETSLRPRLLKVFLRLMIKLTATKVIFVSSYLREVEGFSNVPQFVVHNALDADFADAKFKSSQLFTVLMVCSLKIYKGVLEFFDVARLLLGRPSIHFTLVLNAEQTEIDAFLGGMVVPENVKLFSRQSNVARFYSESSLLLNLSRPDQWVETFGLTILEAMAYGLPVVVPPVGGPAEIVTDGREGFLISSYEVQEIASAIERIASDSELHLLLSRNALLRASDFDLNNFKENIAKVIDL